MSPTDAPRGHTRKAWSRLMAGTALVASALLMVTAAPAYAADTTPPRVTVSSDITVVSGGGAIRVSSAAFAQDDVDGRLPVTCSPGLDSRFDVGTTRVTCTARDAAGNVGSASFDVTVVLLTLDLGLATDAPGRRRVVDQAFPTITAKVTRSDGVSTAGRVVTFSVTGGASFVGGARSVEVTVGADNTATAPTLTAGTVAGNYALGVRGGNDTLGRPPSDDVPISVLAGPTSQLLVDGPAMLRPRVDGAFAVLQSDQYGNESTFVPAGSPTLSITPDASCSGSSCRLSTLGAHIVRATWGGFTGQTEVSGVPGPLESLDISPTGSRALAGESTQYRVVGFDADRYRIGDVTSSTTFTIAPNGSCTAGLCTATIAGPHTVTATNGTVTAQATLDVDPAYAASIRVTGSTGTISAGGSATYTVRAYDAYGNVGDDVSTDPSTELSISPDGSCTGAVCTATIAGAHTVTAVYDASLRDTAELNVVPAAATEIRLTRSVTSFDAGGSVTLGVRAYDRYGNAGDVVTSGTTFTIAPDGSCSAAVCTATVAGAHTITGAFGALRASTSVTVTPSVATQVRLTLGAPSIVAGGSTSYAVRAYDRYGNPGDDVTTDPLTEVRISPDGNCQNGSCTATTAGAHTVTAIFDGGARDSASLAVSTAAASEIRLSRPAATTPAGTAVTFTARAYDRFGNAGSDLTSTTTFTIAPDGTCTGASCTATVAGPHTVTGVSGSLRATSQINVVPAAAASIRLTGSVTSIVAGTSADFTARSYDQYGNAGDTVTGSTTLSIGPDGSCTAATCTATVTGAHTVTGAFGTLRATAPLAVQPAAAAQVEIKDGNSQQVTTGSAFPVNLAVKVTDLYGNVVPGATVTFAVTGGPAAFSGATSATAVSTADGLATAPRLTAGSAAGSVTVTASTGSATSATFLESVITTASARADLAVTVTGPATYPRNGTATLTVKVTNKGPNSATNVSTLLVAGYGLAVTNGGGGTVRGSSVLFSTAALASGGSQTWTVTVRTAANPPRTVFAGAATLSAVRDPGYGNNVAVTSGRSS